jgi:hypothetical protein
MQVNGMWTISILLITEETISLINLRGITKPSNQAKRDEVTEPRHCFSSEQLHRYELGSEFYQRIADRKLEGVSCGFGRDLRALE